MTENFLQVALNVPLRRLFSYAHLSSNNSSDEDSPECLPGCRVEVQFGPRKLIGLVVRVGEPLIDPKKIRPIVRVLDSEPIISKLMLDLGIWAFQYWQHPPGEALFHLLPATVRKGNPLSRSTETLWHLTEKGAKVLPEQLKRSPKQMALLNLLHQQQQLTPSLLKDSGFTTAIANGLAKKDIVEKREAVPDWPEFEPTEQALELNSDQEAAVAAIVASLNQFKTFLLEGVTGSGKTEVYLQAAESCLKNGQQVLVLVPEIGLTPQTLQRFQQRFNVGIGLMHSGLSDQERLNTWLDAQTGRVKLVIGTRSAVFMPLKSPGLIIVDEEHDSSFKQQDGFRYHGRDLAIKRASLHGIPIVLGSATPSLETLANSEQQRFALLPLSQRAGTAKPPSISLLNLKGQNLNGGLSDPLIQGIHAHLAQGNQVLIFMNRRGYAPTLMCEHCGWLADCHQCDARMTLHKSPAKLLCHHCGHQQPIPHQCPQCHRPDLKPLGQGTARTEEVLEHLFSVPVIRIDRDSTQRKNAFEKLLAPVHEGQPCVLVGTQMLAKGHHLPKVTLVAVVDADGGLFSSDFRAAEKMAQLLTQVAGRSGREALSGEVAIQTWHPEHPVFQSIQLEGYGHFARQQLLPQRKMAGLPPYSAMALIRVDAKREVLAEQFLMSIVNHFGDYFHQQGFMLTGPLPAPMSRRAGYFRKWLILQHRQRADLHRLLHALAEWVEQQSIPNAISWGIDVDPQDLS